MEKRRVVITGMGSVNPLGHNIAQTWQAVKDGVCGIAPITQYDASKQKVHLAAEVKDWDPTSVLDKKEVRHMARYSQLAMASAKEAVADSGLDLDAVDRTRCGVIVSSGVGGIGITVNAVAPGYIETDMTAALPEAAREAMLGSIPAGRPGKPEDVAAAVAFLASDEAAYITGQVLSVDGGMGM